MPQFPQFPLYHLPAKTISFPCLMLAIQLPTLQLLLVMVLQQSLGFAPYIVLISPSPLVVVHLSFPLPTFVMHSTSSVLGRLILLWMWPKFSEMSPTSLSHPDCAQ